MKTNHPKRSVASLTTVVSAALGLLTAGSTLAQDKPRPTEQALHEIFEGIERGQSPYDLFPSRTGTYSKDGRPTDCGYSCVEWQKPMPKWALSLFVQKYPTQITYKRTTEELTGVTNAPRILHDEFEVRYDNGVSYIWSIALTPDRKINILTFHKKGGDHGKYGD